jgi:Cu/Ag efflux pump CusA
MTSLATIIGMIPMALKLGEGAEAYAPLARAIIGGLSMSVILTVFLVPAAFLMAYRGRKQQSLGRKATDEGGEPFINRVQREPLT